LYFSFWDGAYDSGSESTNRMSLVYQQRREDNATIVTAEEWAYNTTLYLGWTPSTSTVFGFNAEIGGKTNSPVYIRGNFQDGTSNSGTPTIVGVAPNPSDNMTVMIVKPSSTTFAAGTFTLYGIKDS
jgi:hypothetical protein